ncbi:tumor necrosis factor receptor superfamily member 19-like [Plectropomus leopardus]|uniref:tumor necrosis factor receptor superfamily member 19-like n=1 Tax=Plectropomus leopardus TaxID=160734 RepID=UPI001C4AC450|nr:tumor necrosis factor receptor superfamily member 19-like [Plectropomus leopardus]
MVWILQHTFSLLLTVHVIYSTLIPVGAEEETRECREQEYKDRFGNCKPCKQCDAGQELSKECGFGYGEDARCVPCRSSRFKEDRSLQKCKPCLDCGLINRFQKGNCSTTSNAVCGDCLPGYYRKTKLSGFQDMECIPCGDPPPPYEPHSAGTLITGCLCAVGQMMLTLDEFNLTLTMKSECKHDCEKLQGKSEGEEGIKEIESSSASMAEEQRQQISWNNRPRVDINQMQ